MVLLIPIYYNFYENSKGLIGLYGILKKKESRICLEPFNQTDLQLIYIFNVHDQSFITKRTKMYLLFK